MSTQVAVVETASPPARQTGRWRGMSVEDRRAARRVLLLDAGLEVFGTRGYASSSVLGLCQQAGLTERYFYESFKDREALLQAVALGVVEEFLAAVMPLLPLVETDIDCAIRDGVEAFVAALADDPRKARVLLVETVGVSPEMEDGRRAVFARIVEFLRQGVALGYGSPVSESVQFDVIARALIGAAQELLVAFVRGELPLDREELKAQLAGLFRNAPPILAQLSRNQPMEKTSR